MTDRVLDRIIAALAAQLALDPGAIDAGERFSSYGLDSVGALALVKQLAAELGRPISAVAVWRYPTPAALADHLSEHAATAPDAEAPSADRTPGATVTDEPIAIIGMACRFPGAPTIDAFWRLLVDGIDAIREVPDDRWDPALWRTSSEGARWGGFLDHIDRFDPLFFGISPREAITMDPQQRLMLELTWEALEDAGVVPARLRGSQTGVYIGAAWVDYARLLYHHGAPSITQHTVTGHHRSILANRVSYAFGLHGPSLAVDSACSSALVAVHLACEALQRGDATLAIAGAVNLNLRPDSTHAMSKFGALSPSGRCFTFDARANGYVRGEGAATLVLKRLSRAIADGDPIHCVIRGSAINNDGASNGLTAPNPVAQEQLLRAAYRRAGIAAADVQYVELHGTGTQLGDPIEASALGAVLGGARPAPLRVGSAKTNVGHLEGAAGMVGLIKAALCVRHRQLVPSLHFVSANPHIPLDELGLRVQTALEPWPAPAQPLVAGVSSFGMGGTNAHVVVAEWPAPPVAIVPFAAESAAALRAQVTGWLDAHARTGEPFAAHAPDRRLPGPAEDPPASAGSEHAALAPIQSASAHHAHAPTSAASERPTSIVADVPRDEHTRTHRLAAAGAPGAIAHGLRDFLAGRTSARVATGAPSAPPRVVFVYAGQGVQWLGMGRSLLHREPVFRAALVQCDHQIQRHLGWSLLDELTAATSARLDLVPVGWPASVAIQIALTALWRAWGIEPAAVIGHSGGEIVAAYAGGALSLDDALLTTCVYARMLARVAGGGAMGVVGLAWDAVAGELAGYEDRLFRAIHHGVATTVVAGEPAAMDQLFRTLAQRGTFCRRLPVDVAPHTPLVEHLRGELLAELRDVRPRASAIPIMSTARGMLLPGAQYDAAHWARNFCEPLAFAPAIDGLLDAGHAVFVEISPHPATLQAIQSSCRQRGARGHMLPSLRRDEDEHAVLLDTLSALYALGAEPRWAAVAPAHGALASTAPSGATRFATSIAPSAATSAAASVQPSAAASIQPSAAASIQPSAAASIQPCTATSVQPSGAASIQPSTAASSSPGTATSIQPSGATSGATPSPAAGHAAPLPFVVSGKTDAALRAQADVLLDHLEAHPELAFADVAHALATARTQFEHRAAVIAADRAELLEGLRVLASGDTAPNVVTGTATATGKRVFVFPGQGAQWPEMARALLATSPVFRAQIDACATALAPHITWSLHDVLRGEPSAPPLERIDVVQPVLFAMMLGLAAVWRALGVEPDAVIGHSQGEIAAACVAGVLSLADAACVVARRSQALAQLTGHGGMALVELAAGELVPHLARWQAELAVAAINGPRATVVSGAPAALDALIDQLTAAGVFARKIRVDYASHSPQVDAIRDELFVRLADVARSAPGGAPLAMYSTLTGAPRGDTALDAAYWFDNLRHTVRFADAMQRAVGDGHAFFVEISPHPVLSLALRDGLEAAGAPGAVVGSLRRDAGELRLLVRAAAELHVHGAAIDWARLLPAGRRVALPGYAFQRERYWLEATAPRATLHGLFGPAIASSLDEHTWLWEATLAGALVPYLADHVVDDRTIVPGATYAALALDAAAASPWPERAEIEAMELHAAMDVSPPATRTVQLALLDRGDHGAFRISSRDAGGDDPTGAPRWTLHATGVLRAAADSGAPADPVPRDAMQAIQARCQARITGDDHYATMRAWRLAYGPGFAGITSVWRGTGEALAQVAVPPPDDAGHRVDPRWLDAALQVALALDPRYLDRRAAATVMPIGWHALRVHQPRPTGPLWSHARRLAPGGDPAVTTADVAIFDAAGRPVLDVDGLRLRRLETDDRRVLRIAWHATDPAATAAPRTAAGHWILVGTGAAADRVRARLAGHGHTAAVIDPRALTDAAAAHAIIRDAAPHGCIGAVHLASLADADDDAPASIVAASEPVWASALHLVQALTRQGWRDAPRLWLVTRGAQAVTAPSTDVQASAAEQDSTPSSAGAPSTVPNAAAPDSAAPSDDIAALIGAPLLGFGRTLVYEHPELRCTRLDLPAAPSELDLDALADELVGAGSDEERALRDGRWHTARLASVRVAPIARGAAGSASSASAPRTIAAQIAPSARIPGDPGTAAPPLGFAIPGAAAATRELAIPGAAAATRGFAIRGDASYLVTGGLGGLGLSLARWLVERGARCLVLASRGAPTEAAQAAARALEALGATVVLATADVARRADVDRLIDAATQRAPLRGVFHLAGILDDGLVGQQDAARYRRVLAPKLDGAWHLHRATAGLALDGFVVYSSVAALLGSPGQTGYAAANSFLDALVEQRRAAGLPGLSIAWGPIAEIGLAAALERRGERLQDRGMASMAPDAGEAFLAALLPGDAPRAGVVSLDVTRWLEFYPTLGTGTWFADLIAAARATARAAPAAGTRLDALRATPAPLRRGQLEQLVRDQLARVLQCRRETIVPHVPFTAMGLESLTGLELRNRIEIETGLRLPATIIWTRANVAGLAHELHERLFPDDARSTTAATAPPPHLRPTPPPPTDGPRSDDDLAAELAQLLDDVDNRESA